jgi:multisubunit Na+/H+ antiporter MnhC subunit
MNALVRWGLILIAVLGLGIDAYTHLDLAKLYSGNTTGTVNEGVLFQIEASLAIVAGLWLLVRPGILSVVFTLLITGGGAAALLVYRYVNVGKIGPIPNMWEPIWTTEKQWSLAGELIAFVAALVLLANAVAKRRTPDRFGSTVAV